MSHWVGDDCPGGHRSEQPMSDPASPGDVPQDTVTVAAGGTVNRHDTCPYCGHAMLYRMGATPPEMFCGNVRECNAALVAVLRSEGMLCNREGICMAPVDPQDPVEQAIEEAHIAIRAFYTMSGESWREAPGPRDVLRALVANTSDKQSAAWKERALKAEADLAAARAERDELAFNLETNRRLVAALRSREQALRNALKKVDGMLTDSMAKHVPEISEVWDVIRVALHVHTYECAATDCEAVVGPAVPPSEPPTPESEAKEVKEAAGPFSGYAENG